MQLSILFSDMPMNFREEESTPLVLRDRGGSQKSSSSMEVGLQVHIYFFPGTKEATVIQISSGQISAENVCIQAGKKSGKNEWMNKTEQEFLVGLRCWLPK